MSRKYPDLACFYLTDTGRVQRFLRRYYNAVHGGESPCAQGHYHQAMVPLDVIVPVLDEKGDPPVQRHPLDDSAWPTHCACGYTFTEQDDKQVFVDHIMTRSDTGAEVVLRQAPPGSMWHVDWYPDTMKGPDGRTLMVKLPNGREWVVDSRANNCTKPDDKVHRCWCRHGEVPKVTVDKSGNTCSAGAGSIIAGDFHGFLRKGILTEC